MQVSDSIRTANLLQQQSQQAKSAAPNPAENARSQSVENQSTQNPDRETFDIPALENMSDEEYEAFVRATKGMSETETVQAAEGLNLIASAYEASQRAINGGLLRALNGDEQPGLMADLAKGDLKAAIDQGSEVLNQMKEGDQVRLARLMERMAMALTQTGLNLQG
jgi:hypothetical protein